jgi:hypothetical protein
MLASLPASSTFSAVNSISGFLAYPRGNMENSAKRLIVLEGGELETL